MKTVIKKRIYLLLSLVCLLLLATLVYASSVAIYWEGWDSPTAQRVTRQPNISANVDKIQADLLEEGDYQESWYLNSFFSNGAYLSLRITFTDLQDNIDFTFWDANGKKSFIKANWDVDEERIGLSSSSFKVGLGDSYFQARGNNGYELHIDVENEDGTKQAIGDFVFTRLVPRYHPGTTGHFYLEDEDEYAFLQVIVPYGNISGSITVEGQAYSGLTGACYFEQSGSNVMVYEFLDKLYAGRNFAGDYQVRFMRGYVTDDYDINRSRYTYIAFFKDGNLVWTGDDFNFSLIGSNVSGYERSFKSGMRIWRDTGDFQFDLRFDKMAVMEELDVLSSLPSIVQWAIEVFASDPMIYRLKSNMSGVVNNNGTQTQVSGVSLHEISFVQDE